MENLKKNWLSFLITTVLSIAIPLSILSFKTKREDSKEIYKKIEERTPYSYVDSQDALLRREIESNKEQHLLIIDLMKEMREENQANFSEIRKQLYKR